MTDFCLLAFKVRYLLNGIHHEPNETISCMMNEINLNRIDLNLLVTFEALMTERSVTRAADRLGKTPSAVSHALARLREQVDDPLMVKVGGRMRPSPFALELIQDVRPILRSIQRAIRPPEPFDPATSERLFRVAIPAFPAIISAVFKRLHSEAPGVRLEWMPANAAAFPAVAEGLIDLAHLGGETRLPEGLEELEVEPFRWLTFLRKDHPALADWGLAAWQRWPHVQVDIANNVKSPVEAELAEDRVPRKIGALIPDFSGVAPLLANSDMLGTFPTLLLAPEMEVHGLRALVPPVAISPFRVRFFWSARLTNDPANRWIRNIVIEEYTRLQRAAEATIAEFAGGNSSNIT